MAYGQGGANANSITIQTRSGAGTIADRMIVKSDGKVGINTTSPSAAIEVSGEVKFSGISGDGTGQAVCVKSDGTLGTCDSASDNWGNCTCN